MFHSIALQIIKMSSSVGSSKGRSQKTVLALRNSILHCKCLEYITRHTVACSRLSETGGLQEIKYKAETMNKRKGLRGRRRKVSHPLFLFLSLFFLLTSLCAVPNI